MKKWYCNIIYNTDKKNKKKKKNCLFNHKKNNRNMNEN